MTSIFSSSQWNTSPKAYWTIQYEYQRSGANMQYRFYWKVWLGYSDSYYYDGLRLKLFLDGVQKDITVKGYDKNQTGWSYDGTTEWYTVYNKSSGTTAFYAQLYDTNTSTTKATSSTYQLSVIASQATITSAPDFNDEQNPTIYYSNPSGTSVTSLQACISFDGSTDDIVYRDVPKTGTSYIFSLTDAERAVLRNNTPKTSRKVIFYLKTVVGSNTYYDTEEKTLTIVNANPTFSASQVTYKDTNSATVAVTGNNQHIVQNKSVLSVTFTAATAIKGATITSYVVSVNGVAKPMSAAGTIEFGTINANSNLSMSVTAIDSRGNSTPVYKTVTIIPYAEPTVEPNSQNTSIVCKRCDTNGTIADDGTFLKLIVKGKWNTLTNEKNTASVKVKATYSGYDSGWVTVTATASGGGASNKYFKWYDINTKVSGLTLDATKAYTVTVRCIDLIGAYRDIPYTIPSADVALHLRAGGNGAGFGEYAQDANVLSVASDWTLKAKGACSVGGAMSVSGDATMSSNLNVTKDVKVSGAMTTTGKATVGSLTVGGTAVADFIVEKGTSGIWTYRKWNSGIAECWGQYVVDNIQCNSAWGVLFESKEIGAIPYPFTFLEVPLEAVTGSAIDTGSAYFIEYGSSTPNTKTTSGSVFLVRPNNNNIGKARLNFMVKGKWK